VKNTQCQQRTNPNDDEEVSEKYTMSAEEIVSGLKK